MDSQGFMRNICRICLDENVLLDWNNVLNNDVTYQDCYYKYTQLEYLVIDPFPPMLCQNCCSGLENMHALISKALESHNFFQESYNTSEMNDDSMNEEDHTYSPTEFETVLVEEEEIDPNLIREHFECDAKKIKTNTRRRSRIYSFSEKEIRKRKNKNEFISKSTLESNSSDFSVTSSLNKSWTGYRNLNETSKSSKSDENENDSGNYELSDQNKLETKGCKRKNVVTEFDDSSLDNMTEEDCDIETKLKSQKNKKVTNGSRMCCICSKILFSKFSLKLHEKTHMENRERKECCPICQLKFFNKGTLQAHMQTHKKNREKKHKCEFCDKAFYEKGGLNIHRRIHLGQMISCTICSKEFYRRVDLDRHLTTHSASLINSETKKRSKYFVRCNYCDKSILSTSFKSHTAAHLNKPLMKCTICNKEYFRRDSCVFHLRNNHCKTFDEYNDYIVTYDSKRLSHLYLEQNADMERKV